LSREGSRNVLTVTQITLAIKEVLESSFPRIWIQGEISNFKRQSSGHLYFSLKDEKAQISAVMWRGVTSQLSTLPKDGDQVMVCGDVDVYPPRGSYQLVVRELHFVGLGALLLKLEELKKEIARRGWFRAEHKKPLPPFPQRVGIITSPTGAAVRDIINVLKRRHGGLHILLYPVLVQGPGAAEEIAAAIRDFNRDKLCDVMIVGRGGGSLEDLWAFNEEVVARAIFESEIPIICAVGHETDHTIAEYVADVRAPTPSAAAELVTAEKAQHLLFLEQTGQRLTQTLTHLLTNARGQLHRFATHPLLSDPYALLGTYMQRIDEIRVRLDHLMQQRIQREKLTLLALQKQHQALDPYNVLNRGYSILFDQKTGSVLNSVKQLAVDGEVHARLSDGEAALTVRSISHGKKRT
jgi:exodeoxyribonuclease VII large subunit